MPRCRRVGINHLRGVETEQRSGAKEDIVSQPLGRKAQIPMLGPRRWGGVTRGREGVKELLSECKSLRNPDALKRAVMWRRAGRVHQPQEWYRSFILKSEQYMGQKTTVCSTNSVQGSQDSYKQVKREHRRLVDVHLLLKPRIGQRTRDTIQYTDNNHDVRKIIAAAVPVNTITTSCCRDPRFSRCFE